MNIFIVSNNQTECAIALDDLRLRKMIVETAQMLSTAIRMQPEFSYVSYLWDHKIYKKTHENHPCAIWVRAQTANYVWALGLLNKMLEEYKHRFNKLHKTGTIYNSLASWVDKVGKWELEESPAPKCFHPDISRDLELREGYRRTLIIKWINDKRPPKWTNREIPEWAAYRLLADRKENK